jgi:hypothetical protein
MADKSGSENPGAKQVPSGAMFAASGNDEIADLSVGPDGSILVDCSYDGGRGEVSVTLPPERAALLARTVLQVHGWAFSKDARAAVRIPEGGVGPEFSESVAVCVLETHGWTFPLSVDGRPVCAVYAAAQGPELREHLENYAMGVLLSAWMSGGPARSRVDDFCAQILGGQAGKGPSS